MEAGEATTQLPVNVGCENMKDIDVDSKESKNSTHELVPLKGDEHGDNTPDAVPRLDSRHAEPAFVGDIDSTVQQETADYGRFEGVEIKQDSIRSISSSTFSDICVDDLDEKFEDMSVKNDDISTTPFKALDETAREVRSHAYDLLQRLSTGLVRETNHDSGKPRNHHDDGAASAGHDNKRMILRVGLIISFLVVALIVVIIFLTLSNKNEPQFDSSNDTATESPTRAPLVFQSNCQSVADLMEQPGVLVWEAENSIYFSDTVNVSSTESGYCGGGYATGFTKEGSRFVPGHLDIPSSGYYSISLRYSNNAPMDQEIILSVDSAVGAFFVLRPTQNEWAVESVQDVLMNEGSRYVEVWTRIAHTPNGPNIDWVAMELQGKPLNRSEFLVALLGLADDSMPSQSSALIWMAESDPMDWSSLSNRQIKERFVLVEIFHATYGELWSKDNDNWLTEAHICDWYGVVCNSRNLVTDLLLDDNGLFGQIPYRDLPLLEDLGTLSLSQNLLEGSIGTEIGNLKLLTKLSLNGNFIGGSLPSQIEAMTKLSTLNAEANRLEGLIPKQLYNLSDTLVTLNLNSNTLNGPLGSEIGQLTKLQTLLVGFNAFSGSVPTHLGLLTKLSLLDLRSNKFSGTIPTELNLLTGAVIEY